MLTAGFRVARLTSLRAAPWVQPVAADSPCQVGSMYLQTKGPRSWVCPGSKGPWVMGLSEAS